MAPHPYCADCGLVKFVGADRGRDFGGLMNLLGRLVKTLEEAGHVVTEAQRRLVARRLHELEADDPYALSRADQMDLLTRVVGSYLGLRPETVDSFLRSC